MIVHAGRNLIDRSDSAFALTSYRGTAFSLRTGSIDEGGRTTSKEGSESDMTTTGVPSPDGFWNVFAQELPKFSERDQQIALAIYRALANGRPLSDAQMAAALNLRVRDAQEALASVPFAASLTETVRVASPASAALPRPRCTTASRSTRERSGHGARGTACSFPSSWAKRLGSSRLTPRRARSCGALPHAPHPVSSGRTEPREGGIESRRAGGHVALAGCRRARPPGWRGPKCTCECASFANRR